MANIGKENLSLNYRIIIRLDFNYYNNFDY